MTKIEIKLKIQVEVDPAITLQSVHNTVKEWLNESKIHYQVKGEEKSSPLRLVELETSAENLSYITLTRFDKYGLEENHIKTKIHVP